MGHCAAQLRPAYPAGLMPVAGRRADPCNNTPRDTRYDGAYGHRGLPCDTEFFTEGINKVVEELADGLAQFRQSVGAAG